MNTAVDELLDLVDADDNVIGTVMREEHHKDSDSYTRRGEYWRGTACMLVNSKKQLWIPLRQLDRRIAPGGLDFSMAEHVMSGESHIQAAVRGMMEELNMQVDEKELISLGKKTCDGFGALMEVYVYHTNEDPNYNKEDYQSAEWLSVDALRKKLTSGVRAKAALPLWLEELENYLSTH